MWPDLHCKNVSWITILATVSSTIQTQPGKLNCPGCATFTYEPVFTSIADSKFVLIEFSPELMNMNVVELMAKLLLLACRLWIIYQWKNGLWNGGSSRQTWWSNKGQLKFDYRIENLATMHINISNKELCIASFVTCTLSENKVNIIDNVHV